MLDNNTAVPSSSWAYPGLLLEESYKSHRCPTDFRNINAVTKPDSYPIAPCWRLFWSSWWSKIRKHNTIWPVRLQSWVLASIMHQLRFSDVPIWLLMVLRVALYIWTMRWYIVTPGRIIWVVLVPCSNDQQTGTRQSFEFETCNCDIHCVTYTGSIYSIYVYIYTQYIWIYCVYIQLIRYMSTYNFESRTRKSHGF